MVLFDTSGDGLVSLDEFTATINRIQNSAGTDTSNFQMLKMSEMVRCVCVCVCVRCDPPHLPCVAACVLCSRCAGRLHTSSCP